jgi:hypothetical protein
VSTRILGFCLFTTFATITSCSKPEPLPPAESGGSAPATLPTSTPSAIPSSVASAASAAGAAGSEPPHDAGTSPSVAAAPSARPTTKPALMASASDAEAAPTCGKKPLPDCPLQGWMKANMSAAMSAKDFAALESALTKTAARSPGSAYPNWVSISKDGAEAARIQNMDAVKASCRGCHDQYKAKYKAEIRTRPVT